MIPPLAKCEGPLSALRALIALPPSTGLLALLALGFVLPGLFAMTRGNRSTRSVSRLSIRCWFPGTGWSRALRARPGSRIRLFFHWVALLLARLASFALPFHDAVRVASGLAVLAACAFQHAAARVPAQDEDTRTEAAAAMLLLIGTIGLMVHAHEAITDLATLAACSAALAALLRGREPAHGDGRRVRRRPRSLHSFPSAL